jgi:hypothetical protein
VRHRSVYAPHEDGQLFGRHGCGGRRRGRRAWEELPPSGVKKRSVIAGLIVALGADSLSNSAARYITKLESGMKYPARCVAVTNTVLNNLLMHASPYLVQILVQIIHHTHMSGEKLGFPCQYVEFNRRRRRRHLRLVCIQSWVIYACTFAISGHSNALAGKQKIRWTALRLRRMM